MGMEDQIPGESKVDCVGKYEPTYFGFGSFKKNVRPADYELWFSNTEKSQKQVVDQISFPDYVFDPDLWIFISRDLETVCANPEK